MRTGACKLIPIKQKLSYLTKLGEQSNTTFSTKKYNIECVSSYKYLGIHFTASGTFSFAKNELYKKGLKAYFKLRKDFLSLNPGISTSINVFDHTIKPILLYGSEIWGIFNINNAKVKQSNDLLMQHCYKNFIGETLHLKFCKTILGLNRKSMNHASLSELGRYPLHFDIVSRLLKYCYRLENLTREFPLLKDAYLCSKELHFNAQKTTWYSSIEKLLKILDIQNMSYTKKDFGTSLKQSLNKKYSNDWLLTNEMLKDGKLSTYLFLKTNFGLEKYLTLLRPEYRKPICRLRVSAHRLLIEMGRYNNTPRTERICKNCMCNEIEDEEHFIIRCNKFTKEREELFELISSKVRHFTHLQDKQKLFWILNCEELDILNSLGRFLQISLP